MLNLNIKDIHKTKAVKECGLIRAVILELFGWRVLHVYRPTPKAWEVFVMGRE